MPPLALLCAQYDVPCIAPHAMPVLLRGPPEEGVLRLHATCLAGVRLLLPARMRPSTGDDEYDLPVRITGTVVRAPGHGAWRVVVRAPGGTKCTMRPSQFVYGLFLVAMGIHSCYEDCDDISTAGETTLAAIRGGVVAMCLGDLCSTAALESAAHSFYLRAGEHGVSRGHRHSLLAQAQRYSNAILNCKVENPWCWRLPARRLRIEALGYIAGCGGGELVTEEEKLDALARCAARYFAWVVLPDACGDEVLALGLLRHGGGGGGGGGNPPRSLFYEDPVVRQLDFS